MSDSDGGELLVFIGIIFIGIGLALWWIHRLIAWGVLFLVRDGLVYLFGAGGYEESTPLEIHEG